jgi:hypothetical protein
VAAQARGRQEARRTRETTAELGKDCLAAISECHSSMAAVDPFRPGRNHHTSARASLSR